MFENREEYIKIVAKVEQRLHDTLNSSFNLNTWFILRIQLSYQFHLSYAKGKLVNLSNASNHHFANLTFKQTFKNFKELVFLIPKLLKYQFFTSYSKRQIILAGYKAHNNESVDNDKNKYLSPFLFEYKNEKTLLYYFDSLEKQNVSFSYLKLLIKWYALLYQLRITKNSKKKLLDYGVQINNVLDEDKHNSIEGLEYFLADKIVQYLVYKASYKKWLRKLKPTKIISYCYYDNKVNALYSAANQLDIKIREYQHSAISERHFAYSKWNNIDDIHNHFPSNFMVWNENDKKLITRNFKGIKYQPNVDVMGILHLENNPIIKPNDTKSILICLQGIWMPEWMENFIKKDIQYNWYIRLHPRYPNDEKELEMLGGLEKPNVFIKEANSFLLNELLQKSKVLITSFSGAALEAHAMGLGVIIYGNEGRESYKNYIDNKTFKFIDNLNEFERKLQDLV